METLKRMCLVYIHRNDQIDVDTVLEILPKSIQEEAKEIKTCCYGKGDDAYDAIKNDHVECFKNKINKSDEYHQEILRWGSIKCLVYSIENGINKSRSIIAAAYGNSDGNVLCLKYLLSHGYTYVQQCLYNAIYKNHMKIVKFIVEELHNGNISNHDNTQISKVIRSTEMFKYFRSFGLLISRIIVRNAILDAVIKDESFINAIVEEIVMKIQKNDSDEYFCFVDSLNDEDVMSNIPIEVLKMIDSYSLLIRWRDTCVIGALNNQDEDVPIYMIKNGFQLSKEVFIKAIRLNKVRVIKTLLKPEYLSQMKTARFDDCYLEMATSKMSVCEIPELLLDYGFVITHKTVYNVLISSCGEFKRKFCNHLDNSILLTFLFPNEKEITMYSLAKNLKYRWGIRVDKQSLFTTENRCMIDIMNNRLNNTINK